MEDGVGSQCQTGVADVRLVDKANCTGLAADFRPVSNLTPEHASKVATGQAAVKGVTFAHNHGNFDALVGDGYKTLGLFFCGEGAADGS